MKKPTLTVIIATYNRRNCINECLEHLDSQNLPKNHFEVIVVNDGSKDDTKETLKLWEKKMKNLKVFHQKNAGQGNARNIALSHADGEIILFIGDDIYGEDNFLKEHYDFHKKFPQEEFACLGLTLWDPNKPINKYMKWLTHGGPQFAYHKLKSEEEASFWYFYTSNISIKKNLLINEKFDPIYKGYGWEDIELAYRLHKNHGLRIIYRPNALAFHDHFMEEKSLKNRMISVGKNAKIFQKKHPELSVVPKWTKRILFKIISSMPIRNSLKLFSKKLYWYALSKHYFLKGLK